MICVLLPTDSGALPGVGAPIPRPIDDQPGMLLIVKVGD
jgi:hypothetical protein